MVDDTNALWAEQQHTLGVAAMQRGSTDIAVPHLKAALEADPAQARNWLAYAAALLADGEAAKAMTVLQDGAKHGLQGPAVDALAARLRVGDIRAAHAAANHLYKAGKWAEAVQVYGLVLATDPWNLDALTKLAQARLALGRQDGAEAAYRAAIALAPQSAEAHNNLGLLLMQQDKLADAIALFQRAMALNPNLAGAYWGLGTALCAVGQIAESFAVFSEHGTRFFAAMASADVPHKERHDREQRAYLGLDEKALPDTALRLVGGGRVAAAAVRAGQTATVTDGWRQSEPQIVVIDDFLTAKALAELRSFCWGSNVWRKAYDDGYLGAMPEFGFACPLLAQIAEELPAQYPEIFAGNPLRYLWGFKYDSALRGTNIHADKAAVNVNFWITPDEANRDKAHGGLVIWDKAAPLDWEPDQYNGDVAASRAFLERMGAKPVTIPYRANRAVIFDSDLFHETDRIDFEPGYLNRRINITLLYGDRKL